jgi:hypothetical protein
MQELEVEKDDLGFEMEALAFINMKQTLNKCLFSEVVIIKTPNLWEFGTLAKMKNIPKNKC